MGVIPASMSVACVPGGGGTLIFSYVGSGHFCVQNFEIQYFGVFRKTNSLGYAPMVKLWIFLRSSQNWTFWGSL